ncbi:conserved hypothetical protein [Theileria orientalis strain Shintoku]|uniref:Uncharacterized protein n=1 Tax=Theileria orientalis strain Shintoku TaxID=869250 RepID=J7MH38_THEOR|nr:conserved hypothetical protein [Theileria orientalis strain Shintoku]PVC49818.1 hypothetical protein MACL_00002693 [Theileria orientalis]BAM42516.1 conserved hypothetical protein [Theileria orientalis strain Shintoku]|eukprot:XP_009692817.1 conserved hypothetical protein [Theileria orientalis strain Shintoku]
MTDIYRVREDSFKVVGDKVNLTPSEHFKGKNMLKIQIDSKISKEITPEDVLESIKKLKNLEGEKVIRIKDNEYLVSLLKSESDVFILGGTVSESFSADDGYLGTIHVSSLPARSA